VTLGQYVPEMIRKVLKLGLFFCRLVGLPAVSAIF